MAKNKEAALRKGWVVSRRSLRGISSFASLVVHGLHGGRSPYDALRQVIAMSDEGLRGSYEPLAEEGVESPEVEAVKHKVPCWYCPSCGTSWPIQDGTLVLPSPVKISFVCRDCKIPWRVEFHEVDMGTEGL